MLACWQVEELNTILGNAFKEAHSAKKTAPVSFNKRIAEKLEEQREIFEEVQQRNDKELAKVFIVSANFVNEHCRREVKIHQWRI